MITSEALEDEIAGLEAKEPSYNTLERLSWLYIIRDHINGQKGVDTVPAMSGSEFLSVCSGCNILSLFSILDEHMEAIQAIHPREYMALIRKIQLLKSL